MAFPLPRRGREILIIGDGPLADEVQAGLRPGPRPVRRLQVAGASRPDMKRLRHAEAVVAAGVDPGPLLDRLADLATGPDVSMPRLLLLSDARHPVRLPPDPPLPVEQVDIERAAARAILTRWPLHSGADAPFGQRVHALIAGRSPLADALLLQLLRIGHYGEQGPAVTLLDDDAAAWRQAFEREYPQAERFSSIRFVRYDEPWDEPGGRTADGAPSAPAIADPVSTVFVAPDAPERGLDLAEALLARLRERQRVSPPLLLEIGDAVARGGVGDWDGQILPLSHRRLVLTQSALLDRRDDELARVIHEHYRDSIAAQGRDPAVEPAGRPWEALDEAYRDASRQQADHLWAKLALTDCLAVPEERVDAFALAPLEVERLAVIEHARWAADRYLAGWTYAPTRDNRLKHHPQLIPYADLSSPMKDLDRFAVRLVPTLLARSRRGIMRMLILGVGPSALPPRHCRGAVTRILARLTARYPDRALIVAATLADPFSRCLAAAVLARGGELFVLLPRPIAETLSAADGAARVELLQLLARAERRIALAGDAQLRRWLGARAEILIEGADAVAEQPPKRVRLLPDGGLEWGFEY